MTPDQLREVQRAQPFRPFRIHLADGRSLQVHHREFMSISPNGRTVIVYGAGDSFSIIDALLVTELQVEDAPANSPPA